MTETPVKREPLKLFVGIYTGRGWVANAPEMVPDPKDATKTVPKWVKWKLTFNVGKKFPYNGTVFIYPDGKGIKLEELKEGSNYSVGYVDNHWTNKEGRPMKSKNIKTVFPTTETKLGDQEQAWQQQEREAMQAAASAKAPTQRLADKWGLFVKKYDEVFGKDALASPPHMLGTYIATVFGEEFKDIEALCEKHFPKKE